MSVFGNFRENINSDRVPDGLTDATGYLNTLKHHIDALSHLESGDDGRKVQFIVDLMSWFVDEEDNLDIEKVMESYTALSFVLTTAIQFAEAIAEANGINFVSAYVDSMKSEILPKMEEEASAIPYWNE